MRRGVKYGFAGLALVLAAVVAIPAALLFTEAGGRWVLGHVPGLEVDDFSGTLGGRWSATRLSWQQDGTALELQAPLLDWSPACLLRRTLCINELASDSIRLDLPPSQDESSSAISLPELRFPLALEIGQVRIGRFLLDGNDQLQQLELVARWQVDGLHLERLKLRRDDLALELQGTLHPEGNWPLALQGSLQLPAPGETPWKLALKADGDLQGTLKLQAESSGYLNGRLDGELRPLAENLPASATLRADGFKASADLPDTLTLNQVVLNAKGDLKAGYAVQGKARLPGEGGAVALDLAGRVDAKGADIQQLLLTGDPQQTLALQGRVDWQQELAVDSRLQWREFPWQRLFPQEQPPPVDMQQLDAEMRYAASRYEGRFDARFKGPAGDFSLGSPVAGDLASVTLSDLLLKAGQGRAQGQVKVDFANGVGWDSQLSLSELDPSYWLAELPGKLAGKLQSRGAWRDQRLELNADLDLSGQLRGQPAVLQAKAEGAGERWLLNALQVRLGENRIEGQGQLDQKLSGHLDLALNRLGQLWPKLFGKVQGRLDLAGTLQAPQGKLALTGERMGQGDNRLDTLKLDAQLDAAQRGRVQLRVDGLASGDNEFGTLTAEGSGDRVRQQLEMNLKGPMLDLLLALDGKLDGGNWRGQLARGEVQAGGQDWRLEAPARLERLADGKLNFGAHCWRSGPASLCGGEQRLMPEPKLDYRLRDFPLASLARWLPDDFAWQGQLNADLKLDLPASGPNGQITLDAGSGVLRLKEDDRWVDFPYQRLLLDSTLRPQRIDSQLSFQGQGLGELQLDARIDPRPANKPLSGQFRLNGLDLAVLRPFVPKVETLEGRLQGAGSLSGTLQAPYVLGNLRLTDGRIGGGDLPMSFDALGLDARIAGERMELSGQWRSGEQGQGSLSGSVAWTQGLDLDLALRGTRLPLVVEPYANLEVEPDLNIGLAGDRLSVGGKVLVPRGKIKVRELPPQAVKVSPDARVVGEQDAEQQPLKMAMNVDVEVGRERLQFTGFGLTADLQGHLKVGDNLTGNGELVLKNGRYRAYGQRLDLRRARLLFAGPLDQPYLDVEAVRVVGDVTAGVRLNGRADEPATEVFSNPAMSQEQALSYLILGRPMNTSEGDGNAVGRAALAMGLSGSAPLTSELAQRLGLKDLQLDDDGAVGQITDRLSVRYGLGVVDSTSVVALRYELTKRLYLEAASGLASSLDLFYKRDF
ncbi:translocation/assembly module TamB [Pseudomonas sp. BN414]|uniref:translocation/assembly module TamB domain-containing protein n=1 Tax=Pseudomonas sp. BN414 TaxID=2567888 RepID=UPI0024568E81|nr:translocation/assembly module TamB domain-containing protein [Pseudomonas sp. BN414]MDH4567426.1 translocation/assembly module TamB [Pseudomonas sp. BN414]